MKKLFTFINTAKTDEFDKVTPFTWRDWGALGILTAFILGIWVQFFIIDNRMIMTVYTIAMPVTLSIILFLLYKEILTTHWRLFRIKLLPNLLFAFGLSVLLHPLLGLVRILLGDFVERGSLTTKVDAYDPFNDRISLIIVLLGTLAAWSPIFVAFIEDTIFRHTLLAKIPVWNKPIVVRILVVLVNSILFGAMHYWAFGASLAATIPYMVIGVVMNSIYLWTKNLWYMLMTHIFFNGIGGVAAVLLLPINLTSLGGV